MYKDLSYNSLSWTYPSFSYNQLGLAFFGHYILMIRYMVYFCLLAYDSFYGRQLNAASFSLLLVYICTYNWLQLLIYKIDNRKKFVTGHVSSASCSRWHCYCRRRSTLSASLSLIVYVTIGRGVADSFSGGSPDLKKKTEKTEKTEKIGFLPNIVSKKRCFSVFVS